MFNVSLAWVGVVCVCVPTLHGMCSELFVTRMAATIWEEESRKCRRGQGGNSSQQGPGRGWGCDVLEAPSESQEGRFQTEVKEA